MNSSKSKTLGNKSEKFPESEESSRHRTTETYSYSNRQSDEDNTEQLCSLTEVFPPLPPLPPLSPLPAVTYVRARYGDCDIGLS